MQENDIFTEAIEEFKFAAIEHADTMREQFKIEDDAVTRKMWEMIEILEKGESKK